MSSIAILKRLCHIPSQARGLPRLRESDEDGWAANLMARCTAEALLPHGWLST